MRKLTHLAAPIAAVGVAGLASLALAMPANAASSSTSYQASLKPVPLNTPSGAASGHLMLTLNGDRATISETVSGLADKLPTDTKTLASLGIPAAFAGKPFPHVQHIHGPDASLGAGGMGQCPTSSSDTNHDGVISTPEAQPQYGPILTSLTMAPGGTGGMKSMDGTDVKIAPGGGSYTYHRTITLSSASMHAVTSGKGVIVVHGLNPANAPKASLTTPNSLGLTLPGASKKLALIATAPALCGVLQASQMSSTPVGSSPTGGGSTAGIQDEALFGLGGGLLLAAGGMFMLRRRTSRES